MDKVPEIVKEFISYNPETGELRYIKSPRPRIKKGDSVGCKNDRGALTFMMRKNRLAAHRVAWYLATGEQPAKILHKNGNKSDNRLANLVNIKGRGITKIESGYLVRIPCWYSGEKRQVYLGAYSTIEQAEAAIEKYMLSHKSLK
jgi:hypothetical protein